MTRLTAGRRVGTLRLRILAALAIGFTIDQALAAVGIAAAAGSAAFAVHMINQGSGLAGLEQAEFPASFTAAHGARAHAAQPLLTIPHGLPINYSVNGPKAGLGTLASERDAAAPAGATGRPRHAARSSDSYALRFVYKGMALVQSAEGLYVTRRGTKLPDAGEVISIERNASGWIIVTDRTIIMEKRAAYDS